MNQKTIKTRVTNKHDTEAHWLLATSFVPLAGELIIYDKDDTHHYERFKVGDGVTLLADLPFTLDEAINWNSVEDGGYLEYIPIKDSYIEVEIDNPDQEYYTAEIELYDFEYNQTGTVIKTFQPNKRIKIADLISWDGSDTYIYVSNILDNAEEYVESNIKAFVPKYVAADNVLRNYVSTETGDLRERVLALEENSGTGVEVVQARGGSTTAVMSQNAVSEELELIIDRLDEFYEQALDTENDNSLASEIPNLYSYIDSGLDGVRDRVTSLEEAEHPTTEVVQETGTSTATVMSQKAVTDAIAALREELVALIQSSAQQAAEEIITNGEW